MAGCTSKTSDSTLQWTAPPEMQIDQSRTYYAIFDTSLGSFKVELFASESPQTVNNFVFLAKQKFYDGVIFHRIMETFMIQSGDPTGIGIGGPGYTIPDELPIKHPYDPGIIAMANKNEPNSAGSQFFICTGTALNRNPVYTQFGRVVEGMDVVMQIAGVEVGASASGEHSRPIDPPVINSITIEEI
ncbi:MAG: peptidylprolyl isomerase [Dehalococcoidia bacterium]|nr:peptidylprolyl isomerase [Dehalococcoidia bacterium]